MKVCPNCNTQNHDEANFCKSCGSKFKRDFPYWLFLIPVFFLVSMGVGALASQFFKIPIDSITQNGIETIHNTRTRGYITIAVTIYEHPSSILYLIPAIIWLIFLYCFVTEDNTIQGIVLCLAAGIGFYIGC